MTDDEITALREHLGSELTRRANLGGYGHDAAAILELYNIAYMILGHLQKKKKQ
jgi:hypothetical protein